MAGSLKDRVDGRELGRIGTTDSVKWECECPIGASGATGTLAFMPNGLAIAKSGTGVYLVTGMPITPAGKGRFKFGVYSPLLTVDNAVVTAYSGTAGTATITTVKAGSAAEPASGDKLWIEFTGEN